MALLFFGAAVVQQYEWVLYVVAAWGLYTFVERPAMRRWSEPAAPAGPKRETDVVASGS